MVSNIYTVITPTADVMDEPSAPHIISKNDSQLLFGETFKEIEDRGEFIFGRCTHDGYEGHIAKTALSLEKNPTTHFVDVKLTHLYKEPDFKTRPIMMISFLSHVKCVENENESGFSKVTYNNDQNSAWIFSAHLKAVKNKTADVDYLETAMSFLSTPYLYGGRSATGIDCAGLVQASLMRSGISSKRDTREQCESLGSAIPHDDLKRGDFVFFKGHVGIMVDEHNVLNATARTMDTRIESLESLIKAYGKTTHARRM